VIGEIEFAYFRHESKKFELESGTVLN